jgi:metal-dependent amidase/aminoacylase/carboxypeptidase family protein
MAREGLFNDLDVCLDWHPDYEIKANMQSSQSMVSLLVEFKGVSAHAAADPWNGRVRWMLPIFYAWSKLLPRTCETKRAHALCI